MLNVRYFYILNAHLGGLLFMTFNVTENIKYCLSHFLCSLISIYTYSSAWNLFMTSKQTEKVKKNDKWVILVADVYAHILQCYRLILHTFSEKKYWYLKWVNCKPFIYLLWTTSIFQLQFWFKNETLGWLTFLDSWNKK